MAFANETSNEIYRAMPPDQRKEINLIATRIAKERLKRGDRVLRSLCGGRRGTFTFSHWEGIWASSQTINDCHATAILKINGEPVDFIAEALKQQGAAND